MKNISRIIRKWPDRISIVRHGQSSGNVARDLAEANGLGAIDIIERDMDVPLSELGKAQSIALGQWISKLPEDERPTRLLVSPYLRARQTIDLARSEFDPNQKLPYIVDERLREREFGLITGFTRKGIEENFPLEAKSYAHIGKFYYRPPGGESWCDVILRLRSVLDTVSREYAGENVMIVCHTVIVHGFRYLLDGLSEETVLKIDKENEIANSSVTTYEFKPDDDGGCLSLRDFNQVKHLKLAHEPVTRTPDGPTAQK